MSSLKSFSLLGLVFSLPLALTHSASAQAISGSSSSGTGVSGTTSTGTGVSGSSNSSGTGVSGSSTTGVGVSGNTNGSSSNAMGVYGINIQNGNYGFISGVVPNDGSTAAIFGSNGSSSNYVGGYGVYGIASLPQGEGVFGVGSGNSGYGVVGYSGTGGSGNGIGVSGYSGSSDGVYGFSQTGAGIYGSSTSGKAGYFYGNVTVTGAITSGTKNFKIDHPLDPANKFLYHASVESDRMEDIYNGHVVLGTNGEALVKMPDWFEALNADFEYHLTPIGAPAPNLFVAQEIVHNKFKIAGGEPGMKVSWQVIGVRHDAFAVAHPLQVEQAKSEQEQGLYQNPEAFSRPETMGIGYLPQRSTHFSNQH